MSDHGKVIVIGGGPAGIMAAGAAAERGVQTLLIERGPMLGRKLRICGKGRGNITNTAELPRFIDAFGPNGKFLYGAFSKFFRNDLLELLERQGLETKVERGGRVFPVSEVASDIADALRTWLDGAGARVRFDTRAKSIEMAEGRVVGLRLYGGRMDAGAIVIATGGASYPKTGSTGDGYDLARAVGHEIVAPKPALSALVTKEPWVRNLQGVSLRNVRAALLIEREGARPKRGASEFGEMLFTHFGVSGPIILTLSRGIDALMLQGRVTISIDLKPALSPEQLHARFVRDFAGTMHIKNYLRGLLPRLMVDTFIELSGIDQDKSVNRVSLAERTRMVELLKDLRVTVSAVRPLEEAIVTAGGVSIREIDPRTMMSKLLQGLFFAGEVMDIDAETGGYNLQAAFSMGYVAGESAAQFARLLNR